MPYFRLSEVKHRRWIGTPRLPLQQLLAIRSAYLTAPMMLRELIDLHVSAHQAGQGRLFMFAKALEVVGRHYGKDRATRNSGLQAAMTRMGVTLRLKQSIEWLFNIANERFEIRHAVDKDAPTPALHPRITPTERQDFEEGATLIVRAFVCEQLGVGMSSIEPWEKLEARALPSQSA
jgi:hypothetical protein